MRSILDVRLTGRPEWVEIALRRVQSTPHQSAALTLLETTVFLLRPQLLTPIIN